MPMLCCCNQFICVGKIDQITVLFGLAIYGGAIRKLAKLILNNFRFFKNIVLKKCYLFASKQNKSFQIPDFPYRFEYEHFTAMILSMRNKPMWDMLLSIIAIWSVIKLTPIWKLDLSTKLALHV